MRQKERAREAKTDKGKGVGGGQKFYSHEIAEELREGWKERRYREVRMDGCRGRGRVGT